MRQRTVREGEGELSDADLVARLQRVRACTDQQLVVEPRPVGGACVAQGVVVLGQLDGGVRLADREARQADVGARTASNRDARLFELEVDLSGLTRRALGVAHHEPHGHRLKLRMPRAPVKKGVSWRYTDEKWTE